MTYTTKDQLVAAWLRYNNIPFQLDAEGLPVVTEDLNARKYTKYLYFLNPDECERLATLYRRYDAPVEAHTFADILYREIKPLFL